MKKLLLTLLCLLGVTALQATEPLYSVDLSKSNWPANIQNYSNKNTSVDNKWTIINGSNNNKGWDYFRFGIKKGKNESSITQQCYISSNFSMPEKITSVEISVKKLRGTINSLKIESSTDADFTNPIAVAQAEGPSTNDKEPSLVKFNIDNPSTGLYYRLALDLTNNTTSNGVIEVYACNFYGDDSTGDLTDTGLAWSKDSFDATIGETNAFPTLTNPNSLSVTYDSSDKTVATIDNEGNITLVGEGKTEISANFVSDGTYKSDNVKYTLNVTDPTKLTIFGSADGSGFTYIDNDTPGFDVWTNDPAYGNLQATAYNNSTNYASDAIAYANINLTQFKSATLTYSQFNRYFSSAEIIPEQCTVVVREHNSTEWTTLAGTSPATNTNAWNDAEPVDLSAWVGKNIDLGFRYISTAEKAGTWRLNNIYVKGAKNTDLSQVDPQLYWVVDGVEKAEYTYSLTDTPTYLNYYIGSKADNNYTFNGIEITSSNPNVAKVEDLTYVTPIAPGETTLTVSFPGDNRFLPATADLKLTVVGKPADPVFTPDEGEVEYGTKVTVKSQGATTMTYYIEYGAEGVDDVMEEVQGDTFTFTVTDDMTVTVEASNDNGSSELEKVYLVKAPQTPVFTPAAGEYPVGTKITFSSPNVNKYELSVFDSNFETLVDAQIIEGTEGEYILAQDCIINVYAILPNGKRSTVAEAEYTVSNDIVAIFDFTTEGAYGFNTTNDNSAYETEVTEIVDNTYDVKIDMSGKYRHWKKGEQYDFRPYSGATMTFIAPKDYAITRIEFLKGVDNKLAIEGVDNKVWAPAETDEYEFGVKAFNCTGTSNIGGINVYLKESVDAMDPVFESSATVQLGDVIKVRRQHDHHTLYYMINEDVQPAAALMRVPDVADWTKHDDAEYTYTVTKMPAVIRAKVIDRKGNESGVQILEIASDGTTSAIENITADDAQGEVEYYSLQGIRLQIPAAGTVVIRRQGSQVSKIRL